VTVTLGPTAIRFRTGHSIRLEISSSNFPRFARHPNTTDSRLRVGPDGLRVAHQTLHHDAAHPSALVLPVCR
jgi:predicted acyl esterase